MVSKYWFMENMLYGVGLMLTDEGLMVAYAAKKFLFPTAGFLASCPPGVAVLPWVAAIIKLNPTTLPGSTTQINRGKRQKVHKIVSQHILHYSTYRGLS